jgi:DNA-binding MarR family transcriptional regulator
VSIDLNLDDTDEKIVYFIHVVKKDRGVQNKDLVKFSKVAPSTLSNHIDTLMASGLIERVQLEKNSKILVFITSQIGRQVFDLKYPPGSEALRRLSGEKEKYFFTTPPPPFY